MAFSLDHSWVWDFWLADDGEKFHLFYLHAPRALGNSDLRHRNARIGHATSADLVNWADHGPVLTPGSPGDPDQTATWTGSIVRGPDGVWRMFYTGSSFLGHDTDANIETVCVATSDDLFTWTKRSGFALRADPRWYERLGASGWPEEAWRDPFVFPDPDGNGWHMLITARANHGDEFGRGVIGHATSLDLQTWQVGPPLSSPQKGFAHLEVPQVVEVEGEAILLFCCNAPRLANDLRGRIGGIWTAPARSPTGPYEISEARLLVDETLYAGRIAKTREGGLVLLAFEMGAPGQAFPGTICDPIPLRWNGALKALERAEKQAT